MQTLDVVAGEIEEYVPAVHLLHPNDDVTPLTDDHKPAEQFMHARSDVPGCADDHVPAAHC